MTGTIKSNSMPGPSSVRSSEMDFYGFKSDKINNVAMPKTLSALMKLLEI